MKVTIYDIAREAGVSATTVSKVMNNTGKISDKTRKKILQIMDDLDYQPSVLASAMKGKSTYTIALLIPDIDNPIYAEYVKHIEECGQEMGYNIVMCSTERDPQREARHIALLRQKQVDGFIIAARFSNEELLKKLIMDQTPIALFAHERSEFSIDSVTVDDFLGGYQATEYLLSLGHKRIGVVAEDSTSSKERIRGYRQAVANQGIEIDESLILIGDATIEGAAIQAGKLLDREQRPTAIFGYNDLSAIGVMQAARERGIDIPSELSIIGFDNTYLCKIVVPKLSSVSMPVHELGKKVMDLLIQKIEGVENAKQHVRLLPELVIRDTTAPPKGYIRGKID
jgi:DNA-binding LacI/PurR family transcriptional regulator